MTVFQERHPYRRNPNTFPPIKPEHAQAIGYVAVHWSEVEGLLAAAISFLLRLSPVVKAALTAELSTINRILIIRALCEASTDPLLLSEWDELVKELNDLRARRNDAVHAEWTVVEPGHYARRIKAKSSLRIEFKPVATEELMKLSEEILDLSDKLVSFISGIIHSNAPKKLEDHFLRLPQAQVPGSAAPTQAQKATRLRKPSPAERRAEGARRSQRR